MTADNHTRNSCSGPELKCLQRIAQINRWHGSAVVGNFVREIAGSRRATPPARRRRAAGEPQTAPFFEPAMRHSDPRKVASGSISVFQAAPYARTLCLGFGVGNTRRRHASVAEACAARGAVVQLFESYAECFIDSSHTRRLFSLLCDRRARR